MYQSKYYTCEEIDERLLKGYYDDAVSKGYSDTFEQFKIELASIKYIAQNKNNIQAIARALAEEKAAIMDTNRIADAAITMRKLSDEVTNKTLHTKDISQLSLDITDLNDVPLNSMYTVTSGEIADGILNKPYEGNYGFQVITMNGNTNKAVAIQILITNYKTYIRARWSEWKPWICINDIETNKAAIETNKAAIETNKAAIETNKAAIETNKAAIETNKAFYDKALGVDEFTTIPIEQNIGKFVNNSGNVVNSYVTYYSNPVHVEASTYIEYIASASNVMSAIAKVKGSRYQPLLLGSTEVNESGHMFYFAEGDMDVVFSGYTKVTPEVRLYNVNTLMKKVSELTKKVYGREVIYPAFNNVGYINNKGVVQPIKAYAYTDGIELKEGEQLVYKTRKDYVNLVSLISILNSDGTYSSVVVGASVEQDVDGYWTYTYEASEDCLVVLTSFVTAEETCTIIRKGPLEIWDNFEAAIETNKADIEELKNEISIDKYGLPSIDQNNPLKRINTTANLTSAIRSWGFVGDSLSSGEIWGYIHEDILLEPQDVGYKINSDGVKEINSEYNISNPFKVVGIYPMIYAPNNGDIVFVKSDIEGTIGDIIPTAIIGDKIYTLRAKLKSGDYVRISYPNTVSSVDFKRSYAADNYEISWGQFLCRLCGAEGYNYSTGGRQAKTFINGNTNRDLGQLLKDTQKQAYTIALGQNDYGYINGVGDDTHYKEMGSAEEGSTELVNPSDPSNHGDTFVGYYSELICRIKNQFTDSLIFLITCPNKDGSRDEISAVIRKIYEHYKSVYTDQIFLIDLNIYARGITDDFKLNGLHLNSQGYVLHSYIICTYVDWILRNNIKALNGLPLIGTGAAIS